MPEAMLARVTCPNCRNQVQTIVEQVLDVREDPNAKMRLLNGLVNVVACPNCGMQGALNLPFLYHDPEKELALIYMPMEAGRDDLERQQAIGKLTGAVMNGLPSEERKGYLLQPQIFLSMENLIERVLEADGITHEMIEEQRAKAELLQRMLEAPSAEALEAMIEANDDSIDADLFHMLNMNLEMAQAADQPHLAQHLLMVHNKLLELSSEGQVIQARSKMVKALQDEPSRDNLLELLIQAPDEQTRELLVVLGRPLLDYAFFQSLTNRIELASEEAQKEQLRALRSEILSIREQIDEQTRALYVERQELLRDLLLSDDPEALARRRFSELDQAFFNVLTASLEQARKEGDVGTVEALQAIWALVLQLMEETLPPELQLFNRIMATENEEEIEELLEENRDLVTEQFTQFLEQVEARMREEEKAKTADHLALVLEKAKGLVAREAV